VKRFVELNRRVKLLWATCTAARSGVINGLDKASRRYFDTWIWPRLWDFRSSVIVPTFDF